MDRGERSGLTALTLPMTALLGTAAVLAGCASPAASPPDADPTTVSAPASASPTPEPLEPGTQVASGELSSRPGFDASGSFSVVVAEEPGWFELVTDDLIGPAGADLTLLPYALDPSEECADSGFRFGVTQLDASGGVDANGSGPLVIPSDLAQGDPTFFKTLVLTAFSEADRDEHDCLATVAASAPLVWDLSPRRPGLAVVDGGSRDGARGEVTVDAAGAPDSYTVSTGDTLSGIAERFGISTEDVFYLNPARTPSPRDLTVYAGETLNLSPASRGTD